MRSLSALVIASFIATSPVALAEDGSEHYDHMLQRETNQTSDTTSQHQVTPSAQEDQRNG